MKFCAVIVGSRFSVTVSHCSLVDHIIDGIWLGHVNATGRCTSYGPSQKRLVFPETFDLIGCRQYSCELV